MFLHHSIYLCIYLHLFLSPLTAKPLVRWTPPFLRATPAFIFQIVGDVKAVGHLAIRHLLLSSTTNVRRVACTIIKKGEVCREKPGDLARLIFPGRKKNMTFTHMFTCNKDFIRGCEALGFVWWGLQASAHGASFTKDTEPRLRVTVRAGILLDEPPKRRDVKWVLD